jgi:uncharacterized protein
VQRGRGATGARARRGPVGYCRTVRQQLVAVIGWALLSLAILFGSVAVAHGIRDRNRNDTILVTGSAKQRISSDYVIWDAAVSSQEASPQAAAKILSGWTTRLVAFLRAGGVHDSELSLEPVTAETLQKSGKVTGYRLTRRLEVRSGRVREIAGVVERSSGLLERGIPIRSAPLQYVYTKLASLRPQLLAEASKDALNRAKVLIEATGGHLGKLRGVDVGVFQVTSPNSTDVSDYGVYDTSTLQKDVTAVVNVTFALS